MRFSVRLAAGRELNRLKNLARYIQGYLRRNRVLQAEKEGLPGGCILLAHTGSRPIPGYAADCVEQIRLFGDAPILFICSRKKEVDKRLSSVCKMIYVEDIPLTDLHLVFIKKLSSHRSGFDNFFQAALERFFILYDAIVYLGLEDILHMENDILLYEDPARIVNSIKERWKSLAVPRMNEHDCMASVMYIRDGKCLGSFLEYVIGHIYDKGCNDMNLLASYMRSADIPTLPVICESYVKEHGLTNKKGENAPEDTTGEYYRYADDLGGIFDAAPLGQFIGGTDKKPAGVKDNRGFVNQAAYIDASFMDIGWGKAGQGFVPELKCGDKIYRIFNLHIHCKELYKYRSDADGCR